jgi:hypothetical protein
MITPAKLRSDDRRALVILATADRNGTTQTLLTAHGLSVGMIA